MEIVGMEFHPMESFPVRCWYLGLLVPFCSRSWAGFAHPEQKAVPAWVWLRAGHRPSSEGQRALTEVLPTNGRTPAPGNAPDGVKCAFQQLLRSLGMAILSEMSLAQGLSSG